MITDAWPSTFRVLNNRDISKYFKSIMVSSIESTTKLESLFEKFLEKNKNIIPEESIIIDDRSDILDRAKQYGFNILLMNRKHLCANSKYKMIHELSEVENNID